MSRHEDRIKTYLHSLGMEDQFNSTHYSPSRFSHKTTKAEDQSHPLTDWSNQRMLSMQMQSCLPKVDKKDIRNTFRNSSLDMGSYQSSLLKLKDFQTRRKQQSFFINPVVIKFNNKVMTNSLRRSQLLFHRILHNQINQSVQDPKKLHDLVSRKQSKKQQQEEQKSPPKTERCSGILRMLKRREQFRIMKRQKQNPEALRAVRLLSK